jgi:hypothetical protein
MSDLTFGLMVGGVVAIVVLIVGTVTGMYCKWAERRDTRTLRDEVKAA